MALVFTHHGTLYLVLDEENLERVQQHDPFDFNQRTTGATLNVGIPVRVVVAYARQDEAATIAAMDIAEAVTYLRRGYRETASDHERALRIKGRKES